MRSINAKILKVIGVFSGAEAFNILCSVIKMKLVSVWLGATGVGLFGIFANSIDTVSILTGLGLRQSGVREIAVSRNSRELLKKSVALLRSWALLGGIAGAVAISFISPLLSLWFFGDYSHWWQFMLLAGSLLFNSLLGGEQAILQGTERFKVLARCSAIGSATGLLISIPLFRWMPEAWSVPLSFLAYSISIATALWMSRNREMGSKPAPIHQMREGSRMVKLGGYMALATFATNLAQMIFLSWLNRSSSTAEVGLFQAGNTLVVRYTSIIFSAIGMEFYPRLTASSHSSKRMSIFTSHEIGLMLKIFTPMIIIFILCRKWIVELLYSDEFLPVLPFITVAIGAIILRVLSNCMAFSIVARGDGKTYMLTESIDAAVGVTLNILLFQTWGFLGLGIAQIAWYLIYTLMTGYIYRFRYGLRLSRSVKWGVLGSSVIVSAVIIAAI